MTKTLSFSKSHLQNGDQMYELMSELYPLCRSITGNGVRETLHILKREIPLHIKEIPSGTKMFDWTVPKEWNLRDAYIINPKGEKIVDARKLNLHVLNYSVPIRKKISLEKLKEHLYSLPEYPDWIPYRTSYYNENWGFCISHNQLKRLEEGNYEICVDATLENGSLTYGEYYLKGQTPDEVLLSTHICHPSLCNDNLSGIVLTTYLAKFLSNFSLKYSYRFLFIPGTIGSIAWLFFNEANLSLIKHGLVITCVGDSGKFTYKKSRVGSSNIDKIVTHALKMSANDYNIIDFFPYGYDERQYCSPGINLPVGCFMRTPHGQYPQYHTSADNLDFVKPLNLADSFSVLASVCGILENDVKYINQNPKCEPQLGKRGIYNVIGARTDGGQLQMAILWVLNLSDGKHTLLDISERAGMHFHLIKDAAGILTEKGLIKISNH